MSCLSHDVSAGTKVYFVFHALGSKRIFRMELTDECPFCRAAMATIQFKREGDTVHICEGEDEKHIHEVTCQGIRDGVILLSCQGITATEARNRLRKYGVC